MRPISFVRDHKVVIDGVLAQFHARDPLYVHDVQRSSDIVLLVRPDGQMTYFDIYRIEDELAEKLNSSVTVLTEEEIKGQDLERIRDIAEKI